MWMKPCPMCGEAAEPTYNGDVYADHEFSIVCSNTQCRLTLPAEGVVGSRGKPEIVVKYIERWNRRDWSLPPEPKVSICRACGLSVCVDVAECERGLRPRALR